MGTENWEGTEKEKVAYQSSLYKYTPLSPRVPQVRIDVREY